MTRLIMKGEGRLIIIAAPSGAGKTSVIKRFLEKHPNTVHSVSWTTRPKRPGVVDEGYYHITDRKTFEDGVASGQFAEWAEVHGNLYGTPKESLESARREGKDILLDLDIVGALRLKKIYRDKAVSIFIEPPSMDVLKRRLSDRATDSVDVVELRLVNAKKEMEYKDFFDLRFVNDDLDKICAEIERALFV